MGEPAARFIAMFLSFEVLIGELRGKFGRPAAGIAAGIGVLALRGIGCGGDRLLEFPAMLIVASEFPLRIFSLQPEGRAGS